MLKRDCCSFELVFIKRSPYHIGYDQNLVHCNFSIRNFFSSLRDCFCGSGSHKRSSGSGGQKKAEDKIIAKDMALRKNAQFHHDKNMRNHNFSGAKLRYALFNKVDLSGADFSGADLRNATFIDVDLSNTDFRYSNMLGARMIRVKINNDTMLPDLNYPETNIK